MACFRSSLFLDFLFLLMIKQLMNIKTNITKYKTKLIINNINKIFIHYYLKDFFVVAVLLSLLFSKNKIM